MSNPSVPTPQPREYISQKDHDRFVNHRERFANINAKEKNSLLKPMEPRTWKEQVPILSQFEYWRFQANRYPHIERSDQDPNFFLRGVTCHPRLSDFPTCKDIISDYFRCRDDHPILSMFNVCAPLKEQMSSCINEVFVKNSHRTKKQRDVSLSKAMEERHEKRMQRLTKQAEELKEKKEKFAD